MVQAYSTLAKYYDDFTKDVPYDKWVKYIQKIFCRHKIFPEIIADLACGTGTILTKLSALGYNMIGIDSSNEMLSIAAKKTDGLSEPPILINQDLSTLNLYGTVDAAICCLDSINYISKFSSLDTAFSKISLFLNDGGLFIFDINTEKKLKGLDGNVYVRESEGVYCIWHAEYDEKNRLCNIYYDIFEKIGRLYRRHTEKHVERAYNISELKELLEKNKLFVENVYPELKLGKVTGEEDRIFFVARKKS